MAGMATIYTWLIQPQVIVTLLVVVGILFALLSFRLFVIEGKIDHAHDDLRALSADVARLEEITDRIPEARWHLELSEKQAEQLSHSSDPGRRR